MPIMFNTNSQQQYKEQEILTAGPMELVIMLYDGAIKQMKLAQMYLQGEDSSVEKASNSLLKAQEIIDELMAGLSFNYEIADNLLNIYEIVIRELIGANIKKDASRITPLIEIMQGLREAWTVVNKTEKAPQPHLVYSTGDAEVNE